MERLRWEFIQFIIVFLQYKKIYVLCWKSFSIGDNTLHMCFVIVFRVLESYCKSLPPTEINGDRKYQVLFFQSLQSSKYLLLKHLKEQTILVPTICFLSLHRKCPVLFLAIEKKQASITEPTNRPITSVKFVRYVVVFVQHIYKEQKGRKKTFQIFKKQLIRV